MRLIMMIIGLCIVLCQGCSPIVRVINFDKSEFYTQEKDGITYQCMSDYYIKEVLRAKIEKVNPK